METALRRLARDERIAGPATVAGTAAGVGGQSLASTLWHLIIGACVVVWFGWGCWGPSER